MLVLNKDKWSSPINDEYLKCKVHVVNVILFIVVTWREFNDSILKIHFLFSKKRKKKEYLKFCD